MEHLFTNPAYWDRGAAQINDAKHRALVKDLERQDRANKRRLLRKAWRKKALNGTRVA